MDSSKSDHTSTATMKKGKARQDESLSDLLRSLEISESTDDASPGKTGAQASIQKRSDLMTPFRWADLPAEIQKSILSYVYDGTLAHNESSICCLLRHTQVNPKNSAERRTVTLKMRVPAQFKQIFVSKSFAEEAAQFIARRYLIGVSQMTYSTLFESESRSGFSEIIPRDLNIVRYRLLQIMESARYLTITESPSWAETRSFGLGMCQSLQVFVYRIIDCWWYGPGSIQPLLSFADSENIHHEADMYNFEEHEMLALAKPGSQHKYLRRVVKELHSNPFWEQSFRDLHMFLLNSRLQQLQLIHVQLYLHCSRRYRDLDGRLVARNTVVQLTYCYTTRTILRVVIPKAC